MPTDQNAACENINRMFFTTVSTKQRKEQLVFDLDAARRRVILLQDELDTLEKWETSGTSLPVCWKNSKDCSPGFM